MLPHAPIRSSHSRAAVATWLVGGLTCGLFTCCGSILILLALMPPEMLAEQGQLPPDQQALLQEAAPYLLPTAVILGLLLILPGALLLALGFGVRRGSRRATLAAQSLLLFLAALFAFLLTINLYQGLIQGALGSMILPTAIFGALLAGAIHTFRLLEAAKRGDTPSPPPPGRGGGQDRWSAEEPEPWNQHLGS